MCSPRSFLLPLLCLLAAAPSCTKHDVVDVAMAGAYRPATVAEVSAAVDFGDFLLLAGDTHCHVRPPDRAGHVGRGLEATVALAEEEGLDWVVLSPHLWGGFFAEPVRREAARRALGDLRRRVDALGSDVLFDVGFEYSTGHGHATMAFADLDEVLGDVPVADAFAHPHRFFESWVERGGLVVVNHPLLTPVESAIPNARWNLSWAPWARPGPYPEDVRSLHRLAHGWEAENSGVSRLRDAFLLAGRARSRDDVLRQLERRIPREGRRMTPVGGSDSHSHHLRAVTFVLAEDRSLPAVRDAVAAGRVCIRDPWACTLEARAGDGAWQRVGAALDFDAPVSVRAAGVDIEVLLDGEVVARPGAREVVTLAPAPGCHVLRARSHGGESAPIYLGCPFATP